MALLNVDDDDDDEEDNNNDGAKLFLTTFWMSVSLSRAKYEFSYLILACALPWRRFITVPPSSGAGMDEERAFGGVG